MAVLKAGDIVSLGGEVPMLAWVVATHQNGERRGRVRVRVARNGQERTVRTNEIEGHWRRAYDRRVPPTRGTA